MRVERVVILGAAGRVGSELLRRYQELGVADYAVPWTRESLDIRSEREVRERILSVRPGAVVVSAGLSDWQACEQDPESCWRTNAYGAAHVFKACAKAGTPVIYLSTGEVFDGEKINPLCGRFGRGLYCEEDLTRPKNELAASKASAEYALIRSEAYAWSSGFRYFVVRTGPLFGGCRPGGFLHDHVSLCRQKVQAEIPMPTDVVRSPTYLPHLVDSLVWLIEHAREVASGVWHVAAGGGPASLYDVADELRRQFLLNEAPFPLRGEVTPCSLQDYARRHSFDPAKLPRFCSLSVGKWISKGCLELPTWRQGVEEYFKDIVAATPRR